MSVRLVVQPGPFAWTLGLVRDDALVEVRVLDRIDGIEEGVFVARLTRPAPELGGAFADVGGLDVLVRLSARQRRQRPAVGTRLLVQGVRDGTPDKPPRATASWQVRGRWLDLRGEGDAPAIDDAVPAGLRDPLRQRAERSFAGLSVILRAGAAAIGDDALIAEVDRLTQCREVWRRRAAARDAAGPVATFEDRLAAVLAAFDLGPETPVATSRGRRLEVIKRLDAAWQSTEALEVEGSDDPWDAAGVAEAWAAAHGAEVALPGGARAFVEPTRALVAVDVDRGGATAEVVAINAAAVAAVAEAIAVRQLGGQLVVDFLDPGGAAGRAALEAGLRAALAPSQSRLVALFGGGLAVIERPRRSAALHERAVPVREAATALLRAMGEAPFARWRVAADLAAFLDAPRPRALAEAWLASAGIGLQVRRDPSLAAATFARDVDHGP